MHLAKICEERSLFSIKFLQNRVKYLAIASLPHFFFSETIISAVYLEIIDRFITRLLIHRHYCLFQRDDTKVHTAYATMAELKTFFDDGLISVGE